MQTVEYDAIDPALVRAVRLRGTRRRDDLLRPPPAHAALRALLHARPAREPRGALPVPAAPQPRDVRRALLDRPRRRLLPRRPHRCSSTSTWPSSTASSACSTRRSSGGSSPPSASAFRRPLTASSGNHVRLSKSCLELLRVDGATVTPNGEARGAGGPLRSGKCEAVPIVPRASSRPSAATPSMASWRDGSQSDMRTVSAADYPPPMARVALLGGGKMGAALVGGLLDGGLRRRRPSRSPRSTPSVATSSRRSSPRCACVPSGAWAVADADVVVVAVKPGDVGARSTRRAPGACPATRSCCRSPPA